MGKISVCVGGVVGVLMAAGMACGAVPTFSLAYGQASGTTNQMRSVAVSRDGVSNSVYFGFIQTSGNRNVRQHDWNAPYAFLNSRSPASGGDQPKAIATDDRGNVFIANRLSGTNDAIIRTHSPSLVQQATLNTLSTNDFGGIAWQKVGNDHFLYLTREASGIVQRFNANNPLAITLDTSWGTGGSFTVPTGTSLRGIDVAADGTLYIASRVDNKLYKVSSDLSTTSSITIAANQDVALFGGKAYATSYSGNQSKISVVDLASFSVEDEWDSGEIGFTLTASSQGYAGIDIDSQGRIWLVDQAFGATGGTQDRLLVSAPIPAPGALALLGLGGLMATRRRR